MLKKFSKFLLIMLVMFVLSSSSLICFADENSTLTTTTTGTNEGAESTDDTTSTQIETHDGDLYLFGNNIVMDKYVNGNVFILGNDILITGKVNGNLFVMGNNVKFDASIVRYSIFVCANSVYYNAGCGSEYDYGNLYVAALDFESTYNSYVTGDFKSIASSIILKSAVYRDVDLICNTVDFGEGEDIPAINGNLNYTANKEATIPEGVFMGTGTANYTAKLDFTNIESLFDILIGFGACIVTALALYIILNKLTPKFVEKVCANKFSFISLLKSFGIGLATIGITLIFLILLAGTMVGISLAVILALVFAILYIIAVPMLTIKITNTLKPALKIEKTSMFYLVIVLVSIILHGITLIPFVGGLLGLIINITAIGLIVTVFLPHKELSEEEKLALQEAKKLAKENKAKKKQEKIESKTNKKDKSSKTKNDKKQAKEVKKNKKKN